MVTISVLGGNGYAGAAVVREAHRRGHQVTSVSRGEPAGRLDGVDYVTGSALAPHVLAAAVNGHDVVVEAISPRGDMAGKVEGLLDRLVELALQAGARIGVIGGASSLLMSAGGPRLYDVSDIAPETRAEIETGLALLQKLQDTPAPLDWFYVSPAASFGAWAPAPDTGSYRLSDDILLTDAEGNSNISAPDLARAIVDEIEQPRYRRRRFHAAH